MPRELEGTSMQVYFSPNNEAPGLIRRVGPETGCTVKGPHSLIRNNTREALLFLSPLAPQILSCQSKISLAISPIQDRRRDLSDLWEGSQVNMCAFFFFVKKKCIHL